LDISVEVASFLVCHESWRDCLLKQAELEISKGMAEVSLVLNSTSEVLSQEYMIATEQVDQIILDPRRLMFETNIKTISSQEYNIDGAGNIYCKCKRGSMADNEVFYDVLKRLEKIQILYREFAYSADVCEGRLSLS
jgi:hypothetical protein